MGRKLRVQDLRRRCDPERLGFDTTEDVKPLEEFIGQERAVRALELGLGIKDFRYNIYVAGGPGTGKNSIVKAFVERLSRSEPAATDLCYVHNFDDPYTPRHITLPPGWGRRLEEDMKRLIDSLRKDLPNVFRSEEYRERLLQIDQQIGQFSTQLFKQLEGEAATRGFLLQRTPLGIRTVPVREGKPLTEELYAALSPEERKQIEGQQEELQLLIQQAIQQQAALAEQREVHLHKLNQEVARYTVAPRVAQLTEKYVGHERAVAYLRAVERDILMNISDFMQSPSSASAPTAAQAPGAPPAGPAPAAPPVDPWTRHRVNVLVDRRSARGAPVVVEDNATYTNLFGKIERRMQYGLLTADFTMIRPGSIHAANGGYLVLNADNLFKYWISWEALKIAMRSQKVAIEDPGTMMGLTAAEGLKPEPIPLEVKVILIGSAELYYLLQAYDEDFRKLFNIRCDFDDEMVWDQRHARKFGPFIRARIEERPGLKHFDKTGVARVVEYAAELTADQRKLSAQFSDIMTIIREASYWAEHDGVRYVTAAHVERAIEEKIYRSNLIEEKIRELIARDEILVDTAGKKMGQVNGLSVISLGDFSFGRPHRITANVHVGKDGVVNIEREAELSGKIHTKGLLILKGWLGARFAQDKPLSLSASVTFEQSYAFVDGDSASSTELYALISALSGVPLKQGIAVTGSVNQKGEVQPIGGVNQKIQGFYKVCQIKGLTGEQGVMIPARNVDSLMLPAEVVEAIEQEKFHIWAVRTIDEGIELLAGQRAGRRLGDGRFTKGSIYDRVDKRLREISDVLSEYGKTEDETD